MTKHYRVLLIISLVLSLIFPFLSCNSGVVPSSPAAISITPAVPMTRPASPPVTEDTTSTEIEDTQEPTTPPVTTTVPRPTTTPTNIEPPETTPPREFPDFSGPEYEKHPYQAIVDALRTVQPTDIPENLSIFSGSADRTFEEFDVNEYFTVLENVSVKEGFTLDWVYMSDMVGGRPIIYVREIDQEPYVNFMELLENEGYDENIHDLYEFLDILMYGETMAWPESIIVNDTEQGFFEYLLLNIMGGQFYLSWHANYDDIMIICDCSALELVIDETQDFGLELPVDSILAASELDLSPKIEFTEDNVIITAVFFTKWGGFLRGTFTIKREFPHDIIDGEWEVLIEYECGVMF